MVYYITILSINKADILTASAENTKLGYIYILKDARFILLIIKLVIITGAWSVHGQYLANHQCMVNTRLIISAWSIPG